MPAAVMEALPFNAMFIPEPQPVPSETTLPSLGTSLGIQSTSCAVIFLVAVPDRPVDTTFATYLGLLRGSRLMAPVALQPGSVPFAQISQPIVRFAVELRSTGAVSA